MSTDEQPIPKTPPWQLSNAAEEPTSQIPSPTVSNSPKYKKRATSPAIPFSLEERRSNSAKSSFQAGNGSSSRMTAFYKENLRELNDLQEEMFRKKVKLDVAKDELSDHRDQLKALELKIDRLKEDRYVKSQQINLKDNELKKLKEEQETRETFMNKGHELELQQLHAKNAAELNSLSSDYELKIAELNHERHQKLIQRRDMLITEVKAAERNIANNGSILRDMLNECTSKDRQLREDWLREHQTSWKKKVNQNETLKTEVQRLESRVTNELEKTLKKKCSALTEKKGVLKGLEERLNEAEKVHSAIEKQMDDLKCEAASLTSRKTELETYITTSSSELVQVNEILLKEETIRRKLHNELQELRGNIRVFCRVRPPLANEEKDLSHFRVEDFDDNAGTQSMEVKRDSKVHQFNFDRIFDVHESNEEVFQEIGQLVQSCLDGYNVCIFAYGQTGSGKTFTMLHPKDGIIPLTLNHIFGWIERLEELGWKYEITSEFVEIYNETIRDLLKDIDCDSDDNTENFKHDIRHDPETHTTQITNITNCLLTNRSMVDDILKRASRLRSTAATAANERSSRSHSIFVIKLKGSNEQTGEISVGTLNLVDLAGSERVSAEQHSPARMRETQNINRSLSCLGDVIHSLGGRDANKRHIPFRNSKLTYLLKYSLIGESKTLMFVNVSPALKNMNETLNSLRFASKVNSTKINRKIT
ncbi:LAMI_0H04412g1_1 [Lachancea mirantina]|uniref:Kinesin-like protein n=1 Tax=Lachancea mirantina TaxID=1230905 RepID=A0A1G4KEK9_9SACH|nr:LAMI_0H04412g1_1 [Lachancea mirantina]